jgi:NitT/TauT family transport system substrate-binding protein
MTRIHPLTVATFVAVLVCACTSATPAGPALPPTNAAGAPAPAVTAAPGGTSTGAAGGALIPVRVAAILSAGQAIFSTAMKEQGIDRRFGLDEEVVPISTTGQQWLSLRGGSADVAAGSVLDLLRQRQGGLPAKAFMTFQTYSNPIVVPADSPIKTFSDLSGKRVGTPDPNLLDFMIIRAAGKKAYGLDVGTQSTPVPAAPNLLNELLARGQADAALNFISLTSTPVAQGQLRQIITVPQLMQAAGFNPQSFYTLFVVTEAWSDQHPGGAAKLHDAIAATFQMLMTEDAPWKSIAEQAGITDPAAQAGFMKSQRELFAFEFSPALLDATTSLMNDLINVVGVEAVGVNSVDPKAFIFPS